MSAFVFRRRDRGRLTVNGSKNNANLSLAQSRRDAVSHRQSGAVSSGTVRTLRRWVTQGA